jgi:hypothetical protein
MSQVLGDCLLMREWKFQGLSLCPARAYHEAVWQCQDQRLLAVLMHACNFSYLGNGDRGLWSAASLYKS